MSEPKKPKQQRMQVVTRTLDLHARIYERVKGLGPHMANDPELMEYLGGRTVSVASILRILVADGLRYRESRYGIAADPGESTSPDPSAGE